MLRFCANIVYRSSMELNKMKHVQLFALSCLLLRPTDLFFFAETSSLDSEISQSLTSATEKPLPSSISGESVADVVKPATS